MTDCIIPECGKVAARANGMCQMHNWRLLIHGNPLYKRERGIGCKVHNCHRRFKAKGLCEFHYANLRIHKQLEAPKRVPLHVKRYRQVKRPGHPLANPATGRVYLHRVNLFAQIGAERVPCFWCGRPLEWVVSAPPFPVHALLVDHLDHNRHNNASTNLRPACNNCNGQRRHGTVFTPIYEALGA